MKSQTMLFFLLVLLVSCSNERKVSSSQKYPTTQNSPGNVPVKPTPQVSKSSQQNDPQKSLVAFVNNAPGVDTAYVRNKLPNCFMDVLTKFGLAEGDILQYFAEYNNNRCNKLFFNGVDEILKNNQYNLNDCDAYALWAYTTRLFYWDLNKWLREGTNTSKTEYITSRIVNALNKLPNYEGKNLYRGIAVSTEDLQDFLKGYKAESQNTWASFTSCGGTESGSFAGRSAINVIFIIEHKTGKDISVFADGIRCGVPPNTPPEILIKPNSTFVSTANPSFDSVKQKWLIYLKQTQ